jgi:hypothetical protein
LNAAGASTLPGNFVVLRADSLRLLLPQQEVGAADYVDSAPLPSGEVGVFFCGEGDARRSVVALSERMRLLADFPRGRFLVTSLRTPELELSFAWDEVRVLIGVRLERHPLPPAMRLAGGPIHGYVEHAGELLLCSSAEQVLACAAGEG